MSVAGAELVLEDVSVRFPIYSGSSQSLKKRLLFQGSGGRLGRDVHHRIVIEALRNVYDAQPLVDELLRAK